MNAFDCMVEQLSGACEKIYEGCKTDEEFTERSRSYVERTLLKNYIITGTRTYTKGKLNGIRNQNSEQAGQE